MEFDNAQEEMNVNSEPVDMISMPTGGFCNTIVTTPTSKPNIENTLSLPKNPNRRPKIDKIHMMDRISKIIAEDKTDVFRALEQSECEKEKIFADFEKFKNKIALEKKLEQRKIEHQYVLDYLDKNKKNRKEEVLEILNQLKEEVRKDDVRREEHFKLINERKRKSINATNT